MADGGVKVVDQAEGQDWKLWNGDCVDVARGLPGGSVHYTIFSPPFESLYTFSDDPRDMSNCADSETFWTHFRFLIAELYRVTMTAAIDALHASARAGSRHNIAESEVGSPYHRLVAAVCATCKVSPAALRSPLRARKTARPRQIVMYLATTELGLSTTVVGRLLGGRDHSTVIHGRNTIAEMIETNSVMRERVERIRNEVGRD